MPAPTQAMCTSFKVELMQALHNFNNPAGNTFNLALFADAAGTGAGFGAGTTNYSEMGASETTGTNYVAGGAALTSVTPISSGTTAFTDFADLTFANVTLTSSGALIYNVTNGNRAIAVLNFGGDRSATAGDFVIQFPTADASNAIIRLT